MPAVLEFNPLSVCACRRSGQYGVITVQKILLALIVSALASLCTMPAWAERNFPQTATRGDMTAYQYPAMKIGDNVYRLSPGSRIFNEKNLIIMPASLQIQAAPVMYQLDTRGDLAKVWLLTADEALRYPAPPAAIPVNPPPSR
jgi:hypothetical protein